MAVSLFGKWHNTGTSKFIYINIRTQLNKSMLPACNEVYKNNIYILYIYYIDVSESVLILVNFTMSYVYSSVYLLKMATLKKF